MQVSTLGCLHKNLSMFLYIWSLVTCQTIPKRTMDSNFLFLATLEHIFSKRVLSARFSLLSIPLQSEFSTVPHALWYPQVAIQLTSVQGTVVLPVCLANLILWKTKPKDLAELQRRQCLVLSHVQKFCCNFLLSSLGLMRLKRMIGRKEIIIYSLSSQHVPNVTSDPAFYFWHGLNSLYLFSSLHGTTVT